MSEHRRSCTRGLGSPRRGRGLASARALALGLGVALVGAAGCGDDATHRWEAAKEELAEARDGVREAESKVEARREALREAEAVLAKAREREREARAHLDEAREKVSKEATDAVLFRAVQKRLLEDEKLEGVAVSAQVSDGVVTLRGEVPDPKLRDRALEIARGVPGVVEVRSEIRVAPESGSESGQKST